MSDSKLESDAIQEFFAAALQRFLARKMADTRRIHVPPRVHLRRNEPGQHFHLTPELFLQLEGATRFQCPDARFTLKDGEVGVIPRGVPHAERAVNGSQAPFCGVVLCFSSDEVALLRSFARDDRVPSVLYAHRLKGSLGLRLMRYLDDAADLDPDQEVARSALIDAVLAQVLDAMQARSIAQERRASSPLVRQAEDIVRARLSDASLCVGRIARDVGCSPDHLSRSFREANGCSLNRYIRRRRIEHACELMQDPQPNISEIAWACGFNTPNYFIRSFRNEMGMTPKGYRRSHMQNVPA